ncbi:MAG: 6-pyruvoyl tetrahydropterin synthase family protein [Thermoplasmatota archaeon]|nr:6-pyruvoyl tetrahydropterin synthase family protein [Candidatus Thermoplasmatota archaeon]MBU1915239.1 6-pyruvoyl tetrahydropterin synthase family protein [Candidatus Thermoplasmatota archaeon]
MMRLQINGWTSKITFSATHIIPGHSKCGRLHGHDYAINASIEGEMGPDGVIMDFISVKEFLREVANELDHRVLIPAKDKGVRVGKDYVEYKLGDKELRLPRSDCILLEIKVASAETLANFVLQRMLDKVKFPKNVTRIEIGVDEGRGQGAWTGADL